MYIILYNMENLPILLLDDRKHEYVVLIHTAEMEGLCKAEGFLKVVQ